MAYHISMWAGSYKGRGTWAGGDIDIGLAIYFGDYPGHHPVKNHLSI